MMKKTIRDYDLKGKKVIIRVDFNVPMKNSIITDDNRIKESLETIKYAIEHEAKVILLSHLGRIKTEEDKKNNSLRPVAIRLSELLGKPILFVYETRGKKVEEAVSNMKNGDIVLLENTRFEDLDGKKESNSDAELGKYWSELGDIYINDAFGTSHREHASNYGIASRLPNGIGFLIEKELKYLEPAMNDPERPFTVILGGSKVNDKIGVIKNLVHKADFILIGGGMAYTFLKAQDKEIGASLYDEENLQFCKDILSSYCDKIVLPVDSLCTKSIESKEGFVKTELDSDDIGVDIGPKTVALFQKYLEISKTIIWNGPVGIFEEPAFSEGTKSLCKILKQNQGVTILGGGDTASAAINFGYREFMTHISTGGGASLEMLEGKELPGISIITEQ
ncbi:MAG: phosphoglycerate kinase [Bacilli bacterium]|nr:phosphoglycerate kinase [Bacilli bacterium]